ncbi:hypothetical protein ACIRQY_35515 [Streptomyces sp. NPDC101490]|uniref:hypothetical protein n=1 Tax=Streptomyces sp. NPDC101490 TaxID=3366143 RepID=UPI00380901F2
MAGQIYRRWVDKHAKLLADTGDLGREPVYQELRRFADVSNSRSLPRCWKRLKVYHYDAKEAAALKAQAERRAAERRQKEAEKQRQEMSFTADLSRGLGWLGDMASNAIDSTQKWVEDHQTLLVGMGAGIGCAVAIASVVGAGACAVIAGAAVGVEAWQFNDPGSTDTDAAFGHVGQGVGGAMVGAAPVAAGVRTYMTKRAAEKTARIAEQEAKREAAIVEREAAKRGDAFYKYYM